MWANEQDRCKQVLGGLGGFCDISQPLERAQLSGEPGARQVCARKLSAEEADGVGQGQDEQRLRDEAHRFAIGTHRARRKKDIVRNPLDEIEGIGPTRKRALLQRFGSAKAVSRAALADLAEVPGVSQALAQQIYDHFNGSG